MGHTSDDLTPSKVGEFFEVNGFVAYVFDSYEQVFSPGSCSPKYKYVRGTRVTTEKWEDYLNGRSWLN